MIFLATFTLDLTKESYFCWGEKMWQMTVNVLTNPPAHHPNPPPAPNLRLLCNQCASRCPQQKDGHSALICCLISHPFFLFFFSFSHFPCICGYFKYTRVCDGNVVSEGEALLCSLMSKTVVGNYHFHNKVHQIKFSPDGTWVDGCLDWGVLSWCAGFASKLTEPSGWEQ